MKFNFLLILFFTACVFSFGQEIVYEKTIGKFSEATSFSIDPSGNIFVTDAGTNELIKINNEGKVLVSRGGYGWSPSTFDYPSDVFAQTLRIAVADKNNNRIQFFDKDLTFLSEFTTKERDDDLYSFQYPTASAFSNQGDLFILDSDNSRILKYNLSGDYILEIGSFDAGDFTLNNPKTFAVSPDGKLFVLDENKIVLFDQYGTGLNYIDAGFEAENINITFTNLVISGSDKIKYADLSASPVILKELIPDPDLVNGEIIESLLLKSKIYILTRNNILIYDILKILE